VHGRVEALARGGDPLDPVPREHAEEALQHELDARHDLLASRTVLGGRDGALEIVDDGQKVSNQMLGPVPGHLLPLAGGAPLHVLEVGPLPNPPVLVLSRFLAGRLDLALDVDAPVTWPGLVGPGLGGGSRAVRPLILSIRHGFWARKNGSGTCQGGRRTAASSVPEEIRTDAFILRTRQYGESDRLVTLLTRDHGKITGIAKGAKNSKRRFAGTLEPFLEVRATFHHRNASDLVFLHRCELIRPLRRFTEDLDRYVAGSYVIDLVDRMVLGRESGAEVYGLVAETLTLLDRHGRSDTLLHIYELHLLAASGWAPELTRCPGCGRDLNGVPTVYLVADRGGFLCRPCVPAGEIVRPITGRTARTLGRLATTPLAADVADTPVTGETRTVLDVLLAAAASGPVRSRALLHLSRIASPNGTR